MDSQKQIKLQMSHQKTKRIESPIKGTFYSEIKAHTNAEQSRLFSSRITQKRRPIFNESYSRSPRKFSNSARCKIFSSAGRDRQKDKDTEYSLKFSRQINQGQLPTQIKGEVQDALPISDEESESQYACDGQDRSNVLQQVKRRLFQTPVKKPTLNQKNQLFSGRDFSTVGSGCQKQLFLDRDNSPMNSRKTLNMSANQSKSDIIENQNSVLQTRQINDGGENSIFRLKQQQQRTQPVPQRWNRTPCKNKINIQRQKVSTGYEILTPEPAQHNTSQSSQKNNNIVQSLRKLHEKMSKRSRLCQRIQQDRGTLLKENSKLRQQNERLKKNQYKFSPSQKDQKQVSLTQKKNIEYKKQILKAKTRLINTLFECQRKGNVDSDVVQSLEQVMKILEI